MQADAGLATHIQRADALWSIYLVSAHRKQVNIHLINVDRNFPDTLSRISVEENLVFTAYFSNLFDGLHHANLIVHVDH